MPSRDSIHDLVKEALIKDGWVITADPYVISYGERFLFIDLAATSQPIADAEGAFIGAERAGQKIAVEIKEFQGRSVIVNLEQAIGQYVLYGLLLDKVEPSRMVYLAITDVDFLNFFS